MGASATKGGSRRTGHARTGGRAAQVVDKVMRATLRELGHVGYAALRVEDVAARSGVNKTTVYRRWPTKAELVAAALEREMRALPPVDTGSLRGDLRTSLLSVVQMGPTARGLLRVVLAERTEPAVDAITRRLRDELRRARIEMVKRGIERGELARGVDPELVVDLISAPLHRALMFDEPMRARDIDRILDVILAGAAACAKPAPRGRSGSK